MYKYTTFMNKYALQIVLQNCTLSVAETKKNDKKYLLQIVAAYNKWKMQQSATVSATNETYLQQYLQQHLQQVQQLATVSATREMQ